MTLHPLTAAEDDAPLQVVSLDVVSDAQGKPCGSCKQNATVTIAGSGNWLLGHDRIGPRVLNKIHGRYGLAVSAVDLGTSPLALLDHLYHQELLIVVDACVGHGKPGEVMLVELDLRARAEITLHFLRADMPQIWSKRLSEIGGVARATLRFSRLSAGRRCGMDALRKYEVISARALDEDMRCHTSVHQIGPVEALIVGQHLNPDQMPQRVLLIIVETDGMSEQQETKACRQVVEILDDLVESQATEGRFP